MRNTSIKLFCQALNTNTTLTELSLKSQHIACSFRCLNQRINCFKPTDNMMNASGATALSEALKSNAALTKLNLYGSHNRKCFQMIMYLNVFARK